MRLVYESSPKHSEPWQHGRKGTMCPRHRKGLNPQKLLDESETSSQSNKRYATWEGIAFAAQRHFTDGESCEKWHGYPEAWANVPSNIVTKWLKEGRISRQDKRKYWSESDLEKLQ